MDKSRNVHIMFLITNLLNSVGILTIASYCVEVAGSDEVDDVDTSLKQALFLVELLKSDFAQVLRSNGKNDVNASSSEDVNSTCPLRSDDFNTTMAMNETEVTESGVVSSTDEVSTTPTAPLMMPSSSPNLVTPQGAPMMAFSSWPPMPMPGYPLPPGLGRQGNFPDENYRFPYRFNRRMMPDYYYFDSPAKPRGKFRRLDGNGPIIGDIGNATATSQVQTTTNIPSTPSEETTLHVDDTTTTTISLSTTIAPPSTSNFRTSESSTLPTTEQSTLPTSGQSTLPTSNQSTLPTSDQPTLPTNDQLTLPTSDQSLQPTTEQSTLPIKTELSTQPTSEPSTLLRLIKHRHRVGVRTRVPVFKARAAIISNRNEKLTNSTALHLRHQETASEKHTTENVEMSQAASELQKEFEGTKKENISIIFNESKKDNINLHSKKKHTTTMKIFMKASSRLPIPLPENNAFCYFHPNNALCGTKL